MRLLRMKPLWASRFRSPISTPTISLLFSLIFPLSRLSRTRHTSVIATATIAFTSLVRGARDRPDEIATTDAYIDWSREGTVVKPMGCAAFDSEWVVASDTNRWYRVVAY